MRVCLISAPTATEFTEPEEIKSASVRRVAADPQLGILSLAAVLEERGDEVEIVDLNRIYLDYVDSPSEFQSFGFPEVAADAISARNSKLYGFSSICSSYPLTIRIAQQLKCQCPDAQILFGGPQASVVDLQTLTAFPFVDLILRGEAEISLPLLLSQLEGSNDLDRVPGLSYRSLLQPKRNANAPLIADLDGLPTPAYHLTGGLQATDKASLEMGRGCPFACTFCSTNDFFRRNFRLRSPERVLRDMKMLSSLYSTRSFELVHDMFTVDRRRVAAFCEAMISSGEGFTWSCSARTDCVDEHLLELMARSGCEGIFYGVEVGSKKMQKAIDKHLDLERAEEIIYATERLGIRSTVSLITGFPEESWDDFKGTISMYMNAVRCAKSKPQLNLLAPLAETPLHSKYRDQLILEDLCSEMSHQARSQADADIQLIKCYPEIFPNFYIIPTADLDWSQLLEFREFVLTGTARFRWLLLAIHSTADHLAEFFLDWRARRLEVRPQLRGPSLRHYYRTIEFRAEFLGFVGSHEKCGNEVIQALLDYEDVLRQCVADCGMLNRPGWLCRLDIP